MDINIYEDFLSKAEIEFLTGRKQKSLVVEQLNAMGIPFKRNANGYPIVRRDYDKVKSRTAKTESQNYEKKIISELLKRIWFIFSFRKSQYYCSFFSFKIKDI